MVVLLGQSLHGKWLASKGPPTAPCTWAALLDSMKAANMDGFFIKQIRGAVSSCKVANKITQWTLPLVQTSLYHEKHDYERYM